MNKYHNHIAYSGNNGAIEMKFGLVDDGDDGEHNGGLAKQSKIVAV